jgi:hypothetical protein
MRKRRLLNGCLYVLFLLIVFPGATWYLIAENEGVTSHLLDAPILVMNYSVIVFCAIRILVLSNKLPERLMGVCFYVFIYIWLGLIPLYQLGTQQLSWRTVLPIQYYHWAFATVILGIMSYEMGYRISSKKNDHLPTEKGLLSVRRIVAFGLVAIALALWFGPLTTPLELLLSDREGLADGLTDSGVV